MEFGERLKSLRIAHELTQKELAKALNMTESMLSRYETGKRLPNLDVFLQLANYFDVSADYLLGRDIKKDNAERKR
ncbi:helix-turn-helix domain-containing protein [Paenibacillus elgii]|uniref:helix-turn-helix domain-containing protein n=1 Tax=Paenibacillus elgii TaxID=189691 RepID=UPI0013D2D447|nr:helix-turn-helix transcriptional regulator [Paenibacillus elgii]